VVDIKKGAKETMKKMREEKRGARIGVSGFDGGG